MPARSSSPITAALNQLGHPDLRHATDLLKLFKQLPDPRDPRGIRHSLSTLLAIAAVGVAAGAQSLIAIWEWATELPPWALHALGARRDQRGDYVVPSEATLRRTLGLVDPAELDAHVSMWITHRAHQQTSGRASTDLTAIAVDGKSLRGTFARTGGAGTHLLAGLLHDHGIVTGQQRVPAGSSEIASLAPLLTPINLTGTVVTADALHTTRDHARYLTGRGGHYLFTVKQNQHRLHTTLHRLDWPPTPSHVTHDIGHGRIDHRVLTVLPAPTHLNFPAAAQAFRITRHRTHRTTGRHQAHTWFGITSLTPTHADPARIAALLRGHWQIENRLHWIRDTAYREDHHRLRTGTTPHTMATLRNLAISAISALRLTGTTNIAAALRTIAKNITRAFTLLGIPTTTTNTRQ